jgi:hypothetical protein
MFLNVYKHDFLIIYNLGAKSKDQSLKASRRVARILQKIYLQENKRERIRFRDFSVQNIVASYDLGRSLNLIGFFILLILCSFTKRFQIYVNATLIKQRLNQNFFQHLNSIRLQQIQKQWSTFFRMVKLL